MNTIATSPTIAIRATPRSSASAVRSLASARTARLSRWDGTVLDRLFEAFYTTKAHGTGIGLAVSRTIIQAHGGRLWAAPNAPQGAIFQFTLPANGEEVS